MALSESVEPGDQFSPKPQALNRTVRLISLTAGVAVCLLGSAVLLGWALEVERLLIPVSGTAVMVPLNAIMFVFGGAALVLHSSAMGRYRKLLALVVALCLTALSGLVLLQHATGWSSGVNTILFEDAIRASPATTSGLTSVHAALVFFLTALAFLTFDVGKKSGHRLAVAFGLAALALSLSALFGMVFGIQYLYGSPDRGGVSVHGALGLHVLSVGLLCCRPARFPVTVFTAGGPGGVIARRLVPVVVVFPLLLAMIASVARRFGAVDENVSVALTTTINAVLLALVIAWFAASLNRADVNQHRAERRFVAAFGGAPTGLVLVHLDGAGRATVAEVNSAFCAIAGRTPQQLCGVDVNELVAPEYVAAQHDLLSRLLSGAKLTKPIELEFVRYDGNRVWASMSASIVEVPSEELEYAFLQVADINESKELQGRLEHLANHDALTGLYNRRRFEEELSRHVETCRRYGTDGALALVDLDNFKAVNDTLGHAAGDRVLRTVASVLDDRLRTTDVVARLGGDEFAILLPHGNGDDIEKVCNELAHRVQRGLEADGIAVPVTCSMGLAIFADDRLSVDEALMEADTALYEAKGTGKARVVAYTAEMNTRGHGVSLAQRLRTALEEGSFRLELQPVVDLRSRAVAQYEVLLRLDDGGTSVSPTVLFSVARRLGLSVELDRWVLRSVLCGDVALTALSQDAPLSLNLCNDSVADRQMPEWLTEAVSDSPIESHRLIFEMTESAVLQNVHQAGVLARALHNSGCKVAVDDFGSALVSLAELRHINFDFVKIDGSLVSDLAGQPQNQAVIRAMSEMAGELGKLTIGELVEDEDTALLLTELGVQYGQGYHVGRPAAASTSPPSS